MEIRDIKLKSDLVYEEKPVAILDRKERETRNRVVKLYKVLWSNHGEEDATWETEDYLKEVYKTFFENQYTFKSRDETFVRGEGCNTPVLWLHQACA